MRGMGFVLGLLVALTMVSGCAHDLSGRRDTLIRSLESYNQAMQDHEWDSATRLVSEPLRERFLAEAPRLAERREIHEWQVRPFEMPKSGDDIHLKVVRHTIDTGSYTARDEVVAQTWRYLARERIWELVDGAF